MAWHKSRLKRLKQANKNKKRNVSAKRTLKKLIKNLLVMVKDNKKAEAEDLLKKITVAYARSAKRGIINKKNASRHISRLSAKVKTIAKNV